MTNEQTARLAALRQDFRTRPYGSSLSEAERKELQQLSRLEKQERREWHGPEICDWMTELLYKHDPIRLVPCDVPKDEYENEGLLILDEIDRIGTCSTPEELARVTWEIFDRQFSASDGEFRHSEAGQVEDQVYQNIGQEIFDKFYR